MTKRVFSALCGLFLSLTMSVWLVSFTNPTAALAYSSADTSQYPLLKNGDSGYRVKVLQWLLVHRGRTVAADGVFGPGTAAAVKRIQASHGLAQDAIVGSDTWGALLGVSAGTTPPPAGSPGQDTRYPNPKTAGYSNGKLPSSVLCQVPGARAGYRISCRALPDFTAMAAAYRAKFGLTLQVDHVNPSSVNCYRTYDQQVVLWNKYQSGTGAKAARPGASNHGWGLACDINMRRNGGAYYTSATYYWLRDNAAKYGFKNDVSGEDWHWTYTR